VPAEETFDVSRSQLAGMNQGRFQGAQAGSHLGQAIHNFQQDRFHVEDDIRIESGAPRITVLAKASRPHNAGTRSLKGKVHKPREIRSAVFTCFMVS
jgi:hypothetical protein